MLLLGNSYLCYGHIDDLGTINFLRIITIIVTDPSEEINSSESADKYVFTIKWVKLR